MTFFHVIFDFSTVRLKQTSSLDDSSDDNDSELDDDVAEPQLLNKLKNSVSFSQHQEQEASVAKCRGRGSWVEVVGVCNYRE